MPRYNAPFEIHVHGDVPLRSDVTFAQIQEALKPLWTYAGARSLADGATTADGKDYLVVATTRPETLLGDAAVGVKPSDEG